MNPQQIKAHAETFMKSDVIAKMVKAENGVDVLTILSKATPEQRANIHDVIDGAKLYVELLAARTNEIAAKVRAEGIPVPPLDMAEVDSLIDGARAFGGEDKPSMSEEQASEFTEALIARTMRKAFDPS